MLLQPGIALGHWVAVGSWFEVSFQWCRSSLRKGKLSNSNGFSLTFTESRVHVFISCSASIKPFLLKGFSKWTRVSEQEWGSHLPAICAIPGLLGTLPGILKILKFAALCSELPGSSGWDLQDTPCKHSWSRRIEKLCTKYVCVYIYTCILPLETSASPAAYANF